MTHPTHSEPKEIAYEHPLSWNALIRVVLVAIIVFVSWKALWIFVDILIAIMFATALYPIVHWIHKKLPWILSVITTIILILLPFVLVGIFVMPTLIRELPGLLSAFYTVISHISFLPQSIRDFNFVEYLNQHATDLLSSAPTIFLDIVAILTVFFSMFYLLLDHLHLTTLFMSLFPGRERNKIRALLDQLATVNGQYIRGNIIISLICGVIIFIGLFALHVPYALPLAIFAGILDLLPLVGSTIGAIPAVVIAFTISPLTGILVLILHLTYQQLENVVISPAIYNKALNLSPALSFLSVVVGGGLFGILGAFLALPVAASIPVLLHYIHDYSERNAGNTGNAESVK